MSQIVRPARDLQHPGFVVFEGLDLTGKTFLAKRGIKKIKSELNLAVTYNHNHGFLNKILVDEKILQEASKEKRLEYLLSCYSKDALTANPREFSEIFQDRYYFYPLFSGILHKQLTLDSVGKIASMASRPKHVFLVECSYEERLRRALHRESLSETEKASLSSRCEHERLKSIYREILGASNIPHTLVDTTNLPEEELLNLFISQVGKLRLFAHEVDRESLVVDHERDVFKSTFEFN